jgi:hypothetical protein
MMFYERLHERFSQVVQKGHLLDEEIEIKTHILKPTEAIGKPERDDFPLLRGKEVLMQATFMGVSGQAYTDAPSAFTGPLREILDLELDQPAQKALFVAALNAVMRYLHPDIMTIHCKHSGPRECAEEMKRFAASLKPGSAGLIGLQPAILDAIVSLVGASNMLCLDRDEENIHQLKCGVHIEPGNRKSMEEVFKASDFVLATGSSITNGSIVEILDLAKKYKKPVHFYGTTIAGTARLMGLNHLCFKST